MALSRKHTAFAILAFYVCGALAGCAQLTAVVNWIDDPNTIQAAAQLRGWTQIIACGVSDAAALATKIETAINTGSAIQDTSGNIYTGSALVCTALGGTPGAKMAVRHIR